MSKIRTGRNMVLGILAAASLAAAAPETAPGGGAPGQAERYHDKARFDGEHRGGEMGFFHPRLIKELNLTPEQQKKFKDYRLGFEKRKIQLRSDKAMLELDLKNVLSTYPVNQAQAMKIGEKIGDLEKKSLLLKVEAWSQFLANLSPEQHQRVVDFQAEFKQKRREWRERHEGPGEPGDDH